MATSAYQIEGGVDLDGRGPSIWDTFCAEPGRVRGGDDGRVADDHRRRMPADVALLAGLGVGAYRFSVAWPRVQPAGSGPVSEAGLDFYRELVDRLLGAGIEPLVTLYHWDLPQALEDAGGWPVRDTAARFAEYAAVVAGALGDRVRRWTTVNEPWCAAMLGYAGGVHAPGRAEPGAAMAAAHHLLLGHGLAVGALRAAVGDGAGSGSGSGRGEVAVTLNPSPVVPADPTRADDVEAARRVDGIANRWWFDALLRGAYPDDVLADVAAVTDLAFVRDGDLAVIATPLDALGVNYYFRHHVRGRAGASSRPPASTWPGSPDVELIVPRGPTTAMGWPIEPDGLRQVLVRLSTEYGAPPLYVHENGAAFPDVVEADGSVPDPDRVAFLAAHLAAAHQALASGVDLRGYFAWSLMDNFEWAEGYARRFGLVHVDYGTQRRTPKASAWWYRDVATSGVLP